jgi:hypothetical protein
MYNYKYVLNLGLMDTLERGTAICPGLSELETAILTIMQYRYFNLLMETESNDTNCHNR